MTNALSLRKENEAEIRRSLTKSIGLIVVEKNGIVVITKTPNPILFYEIPEKNSHLFLWGIAGSDTDGRTFQAEFMSFLSKFKNLFSERDVNIMLIQDFIGSYLKKKFYNIKFAEPIALEFILGTISNGRMLFFTIDYKGNSINRSVGGINNMVVIGAYDTTSIKLLENIAKMNVSDLKDEDIAKRLEPQFNDFSGVLHAMNFNLTQPPKETKKRS